MEKHTQGPPKRCVPKIAKLIDIAQIQDYDKNRRVDKSNFVPEYIGDEKL